MKRFITIGLRDTFKKQISEAHNELVDEIKKLKKELNDLKRPRK